MDVTANQRTEALSLSVYLRDSRNIDIFYASMARLGLPPVALDAGETRTFTVHLKLHLAGGAFLVGAAVSSYGRQVHTREDQGPTRPFQDPRRSVPLGTILIKSPMDVGTLANLYPYIRSTLHANKWIPQATRTIPDWGWSAAVKPGTHSTAHGFSRRRVRQPSDACNERASEE